VARIAIKKKELCCILNNQSFETVSPISIKPLKKLCTNKRGDFNISSFLYRLKQLILYKNFNAVNKMQVEKSIEDLKEFKKIDWLEKEFQDLFDKINEYETCIPNENFKQFTYNSPIVIKGEIIFNEVLVTFEDFKFQKFQAKINLIQSQFEEMSQLEKIYYCEALISKLKQAYNDFSKYPELKNLNLELKTAIKQLLNQLSIYLKKPTKKNSFRFNHSSFAKISLIYKALVYEKLIGDEVLLEDFELIFRNQIIQKLIHWTGTTSELKYFIKIISTPEYGFEDTKDEKWQIAVNCFTKVKKRSTEIIDYKNLRTYKITPSTIKKIDSLIVIPILKQIRN